MNKRKIATSALIGVGAFFIFMTATLSIQDQFVDFGDSRLHIAGAIQTDSGLFFFGVGMTLLLFGLKFRKVKATKTEA